MTTGYDQIKALSKESGINIPDLLALARNNDPFFAGAPSQREKAEWFAALWRERGFGTGVHLRRVHYQLVSTDARMVDGRKYENTERCWGELCNAGKAARYLRLVSPTAFEDRRNPPPNNFVYQRWSEATPAANVYQPYWTLPSIQSDLPYEINWPMPAINGYDYEQVDQPYHLVLFVEKSTMNDVLEPLCRRLGMDYITSLGFQSITTIVGLLRRVQELRKPARVFYISDFDPAGDFMPAAVARQLEYHRPNYCEYEVKLEPICLTAEQVRHWNLPPIPIKDSDLRANGFTDRYGVVGATELDAMEALHPGELAKLVEEAAAPYIDQSLQDRLDDTHVEAEDVATREWRDHTYSLQQDVDLFRATVRAIAESYQERLTALNDELQRELEPIMVHQESLASRLADTIATFEPELPDRPEPNINIPDEDTILFDSNRDYLTQLQYYKARRNGE